MRVAAQATYWSAVVPNVCGALNRPLWEGQLEATTALAAKADLLTAGVAVDEYARVLFENDASKVHDTSPWAADQQVTEVIRPAPVWLTLSRRRVWLGTWLLQSHNGGSCLLRKRCRLQNCTTSCSQSSKLSCSMPRDRALARVGQPCTSPRQRCERTRNGGWLRRCGSARRLMQDHAPRVLCAKATTETCASSRRSTRFTLFAAREGVRARPHRAVLCTLHSLIQQAGGCPGALLLGEKQQRSGTRGAVRHLVRGLLFCGGVMQQLWKDVSVRCPHAERCTGSTSKPGVAAVAGETEKTKGYGVAVRWLAFETYGRLGGEGITAAANGQCSPHAVCRWRTQQERVLLSALADTHLRALRSSRRRISARTIVPHILQQPHLAACRHVDRKAVLP